MPRAPFLVLTAIATMSACRGFSMDASVSRGFPTTTSPTAHAPLDAREAIASASRPKVPERSTEGRSNGRRSFLISSVATTAAARLSPRRALASDEANTVETTPASSPISNADVAKLLRDVPTFTIVDEGGVPFMVVGEDAKVTGYFFTTFPEADRILSLAKSGADRAIREAEKEGETDPEMLTNPWTSARISAVPLDSALLLVSKSNRKNFFRVAPAEADVRDALELSGTDDLAEGKVPLFYFSDFAVGESQSIPVYFRKSELEAAYRKAGGKRPLPKIQVTELTSLLGAMVGSDDEELKSLRFVAPRESSKKKAECERKGGDRPPFVIGQRNIVL